jgi:hypothetical protein
MSSVSKPIETFLDCIGNAEQNLRVSLLNVPGLVRIFDRTDQHLKHLTGHLSKIDFEKNDPAYIILNLMALAQRQMRNCFVAFLRRQGYDGQLLFRVGVEATVFAYRIFEKPELGLVWVNKDRNQKAYRKAFEQEELPGSLPYRKPIKDYLTYLSENRSHASLPHFAGTLKREEGRLGLNYFDGEELWLPTLLGFLKMSLIIATVFRKMIDRTAPVFVTSTEDDFKRVATEFHELAVKYVARAAPPSRIVSVSRHPLVVLLLGSLPRPATPTRARRPGRPAGRPGSVLIC